MRLGILGAGRITLVSHLPVLCSMPEVTVEWICDKAPGRARELADKFRVKSAFTDLAECREVDAALVATPVGSRKDVVPAILRRGWHVFCEKPFARSTSEHDAYLANARAAGVELGVALVRRYAKPFVMARRLVASGVFGPIVRVYAGEGSRMKRTGQGEGWYMTNPSASGGGVLMETGSHLVDQVFTLLGATEFELRSCVQDLYEGIDLATRASARIAALGQTVECDFELSMVEDLPNAIFVQFRDVMLKIDLAFEGALELQTRDGAHVCHIALADGAATHLTGFYLEWRDFVAQCLTGKPTDVSAESSRVTTAFIEACYRQSSQSNLKQAHG